jgi:hypothetical protein
MPFENCCKVLKNEKFIYADFLACTNLPPQDTCPLPKVSFDSFYFLFTIVMKVLISCTENPKNFIEVLDELELFIDKIVIFDEKKKFPSVRLQPSAVCQQIL